MYFGYDNERMSALLYTHVNGISYVIEKVCSHS